MKECWSEGELRAFIDRELPAEEMDRVAAHLEECSACGDLWAELAGRAARVSALMSELAEPGPAVSVPRMPRRAGDTRQWAWAAVALAAGLVIGIVALSKRPPQVAAVSVAPPAAAVQSAANRGESPAPAEPSPHVVSLAADRPSRTGLPKRTGGRPAPQAQSDDPFLALDDEPIETGVVWRVELGPRQVPADVIIGSDGRPRAIRLVNFRSNR